MAQLLSPVCTDVLKIQNPLMKTASRSLPKTNNTTPWSWNWKRRSSSGFGRLRVATDDSPPVADDYYAVLGLVIM